MYERIKVRIPNDLVKKSEVYNINFENNNYPLFRIDRGSYIDELEIDSSINISEETFNEGVHNVEIGQFCSISYKNFFTINRNNDYKSVTMACSKLINTKRCLDWS